MIKKISSTERIVFILMPIAIISFLVWNVITKTVVINDGALFGIGIFYIIVCAATSNR